MKNILDPSKNCWKTATAQRAAFIIDGENYFRALHEAMIKAQRSIMIVGWDLHSELKLVRKGESEEFPDKLGKLLDFLVRRNKELHVYLLSWDFAMIYALEREFFPRYKLKWTTHRRIHFCLDGEHPIGASQHQKIVVIDDAVAFSGGLDLSKWRWDTSEHKPDNRLREDPDGQPYPPFHDVQMIVDGEVAKALGELTKFRWERACGETTKSNEVFSVNDPWPTSISPDFNEIPISISRTFPAYKDYPEVREVEQLYLDSIASARELIYIENQYLSSFRVGEALKASLEQAYGPEIVIIQPKKTGGWLEQHTMDVLRGRILNKLRQADLHSRLKIYYPQIALSPSVDLMVHAKVMLIDDCFARVGSSNLSNRSLGLDSECDLVIATTRKSSTANAITAFRHRLLAEHLGVKSDDIAHSATQHNSVIKAIESLRKGERTLVPLQGKIPEEVDQWVPESELLDPEKPIEPKELFNYFISPQQQLHASRHLLQINLLIIGALCLFALMYWTSLASHIDLVEVKNAMAWLKHTSYAPIVIPLVYMLAGLISFPITLLIIATVVIFGPWQAIVYSLIGAEFSAISMFIICRKLGRRVVRKFAGNLLNRLSHTLSESGIKAVITLRIFPVASFSLINMIAGVSEIRLRDFALGSFIGLIPGVVVIVLIGNWIAYASGRPASDNFIALLSVTVLTCSVLVGFLVWLRRKPSNTVKTHNRF